METSESMAAPGAIRGPLPFHAVRSAWISAKAPFRRAVPFVPSRGRRDLKIILLDIGLPGMSALEGLEYIIGQYPHSDVVMLTSNENPEVIFSSIQKGAVAYLSKKSSLESIATALETVCRGESFMSPYIARIVFNFIQSKPRKAELPHDLTPRQLEIVQGLKEGLSYKMIADRLDITIETVRDHIKNIYRRLQVNSRAEAVRKYLEENK